MKNSSQSDDNAMTRQKTRQLASGYSCLLQVPLRVSYDLLFLLFPLAPASSESYSGPLHNLLPPRCCVCRVKSLIAVSRRKCVIHSHTCILRYLCASVSTTVLAPLNIFCIHRKRRVRISSWTYSRPLFSFVEFD